MNSYALIQRYICCFSVYIEVYKISRTLCTHSYVYIQTDACTHICIYTHTSLWIKELQTEFFSGINQNWKQVPGIRLSHQILFVLLTEWLHCTLASGGVCYSDQAQGKTHLEDRWTLPYSCNYMFAQT